MVTPQTCDGSFSSSVISLSSGNSSMSPSSLDTSEKDVFNMTIRTAQNTIIQLKAMLNRQNADIRKMWSERRAFVKIITEYRKEQGDSTMARVELDTSEETSPPPVESAPWDTSNLSETCRNYLLVRISMLKDLQVLQQQEDSRKRERSLDTSVEILSPPRKKPVKERLGSRNDTSTPVTPHNTPAESLEVNLSTQFTVENDSYKDESVPLVELSSSSSGVDTESSPAPSISPQEISRPSPIATRGLTATQSTPFRRALLPDFEKPKLRPSTQ